jgi:hypothetical protein
MSIGFVKVKKIEYFISKNQVKIQEWLWGFLSKNWNNLKNSIGYWAGFLINTRDCIPAFKCIEPSDLLHTRCSLTFKKPEPTCYLKFLISIDLDPLWIFKKKFETWTRLLSKNIYTSAPHWSIVHTSVVWLSELIKNISVFKLFQN